MLKITLSILISLAGADAKPWTGYIPTATSNIAFKDKILAATFETLSAGGTLLTEDNYKIVDVDSVPQETNKNVMDTDYRVFQIETCRRQNIKKCPVSASLTGGTAYIEEGYRLTTCRHTMHNWFYLVNKYNNLDIKDIIPALLIWNYKKEVVYNSAYSPQIVKPTFFNDDPRNNKYMHHDTEGIKNNAEYANFFAFADFFEFEFSENIVAPVKFNKARTSKDITMAYISGYPGVTDLFPGTDAGESDGEQLLTSAGPAVKLFYGYRSVVVDAVATSGMSGGLVLNQDGEKLGVACIPNGDNPMHTNILLDDKRMLTKLWDYLLTN